MKATHPEQVYALNLTTDVHSKLLLWFGLVKKCHSDNYSQVQVQFEGNKFIQSSKRIYRITKSFMI